MKLVLMTKSTFFVEEDKIISSLFEEGLENLHLYKPDSTPIYSERLLSLLPEDYYRKITVHDHYYLKNEYRLAGIHIDSPDAPLPDGYKGKFSRTCMQLEKLKETKRKSEYVFLRNIFHSLSEKGAEATFTQEQIKDASRKGLIDKHVYALGGIGIEQVKFAKDMGFGGVVICGDLWNRFDIHNQLNYKELIAHFAKFRRAVG
ncbi:MAG: thiamine phosphate synthase [Prevotellaceae bacterium]|nr:thiamine phosphate synthase [Prevotella sp.]MDD7257175.1 thiamine phosphate synthase [Prevotellaceae bacterium]MDY6130389.1 thiamine phosphate synthase [Prevotella sp.]